MCDRTKIACQESILHAVHQAIERYASARRRRRRSISVFELFQAYLVKRVIKACSRPIFVVASPRSGTTALCRALNEHSQILMAWGGAPMLQWIGAMAHAYEFGPTADHFKTYTGLLSEALRMKLQALAFDCVWADPLRILASSDKLELHGRSEVWRALKIWGCKVSPDAEGAHGLEWLFPSLRFVYIVRNGIDVVYSMSRFISFRDRPFERLCRDWSERVWRYEYLTKRQNAIRIRFEDFLDQPEETLAKVLGCLDLPLETRVTNFCRQNLVHPLDGPSVRTNPKSVLRNRPAPHTAWSESQKKVFRQVCENAMNHLDYSIPF
jgi:hypothetical protein